MQPCVCCTPSLAIRAIEKIGLFQLFACKFHLYMKSLFFLDFFVFNFEFECVTVHVGLSTSHTHFYTLIALTITIHHTNNNIQIGGEINCVVCDASVYACVWVCARSCEQATTKPFKIPTNCSINMFSYYENKCKRRKGKSMEDTQREEMKEVRWKRSKWEENLRHVYIIEKHSPANKISAFSQSTPCECVYAATHTHTHTHIIYTQSNQQNRICQFLFLP